jgi:hypothetical protein
MDINFPLGPGRLIYAAATYTHNECVAVMSVGVRELNDMNLRLRSMCFSSFAVHALRRTPERFVALEACSRRIDSARAARSRPLTRQ